MKWLSVCSSVLVAVAAAGVIPASAQQAATPPVTPSLDFSGVVFGSYGYRTDSAGRAALGGSNPNQFSVDRAYLNFKMPAGDNGQIRVTTDIFQNTNSATNGFYGGWAIRLKYAYLQYGGLKDALGKGSSVLGRIGLLHTVIIDHEEGFWPRYLGPVATDRNGFFASSDAGAAGLVTLPNKWGEVYATITNGPGYTASEHDRFKDVAARVSFTPLANDAQSNPIIRSFAITPWFYKGKVGSSFASGGAGQVGAGANGAVTDGLQRDRYGIFAGLKERRLTAGVELAERKDASERGANTGSSPRVVTDSTGRLADAFIIMRPQELFGSSAKSAWSLVGRYDRYTPNASPSAVGYAGSTPSYNYWVLGAAYDLNQRITFALDWQAQSPSGFPAAGALKSSPRQSSIFLHWQASF